jgi:hypothetical protein
MAQFIPDWLADLLAGTVLVMFTELYKFAKMIMILSFLAAIFGFTWYTLLIYIIWGGLFSIYYTLIR